VQNPNAELSQRLQLILDAVDIGTWTWRFHDNFVTWDDKMHELFGAIEPFDGSFQEFDSYVLAEDRTILSQRVEASLKTGIFEAVFRIKRKNDNQIRWIAAKGQIYSEDNENTTGMRGINLDITDKKTAEDLEKAKQEYYREIFESNPSLMWESGLDKSCTYFNKSWLDFTGKALNQELGNGWTEGVHPKDLSKCMEIYTEAFDRKEEFIMEYRLKHHSGIYRWILDKGAPRYNAKGEFIGYLGSCIDIDDLKKNSLESHDLKRALENTVEGISKYSINGICIYANETYHLIHGYEPGEYINKKWIKTIDTRKQQIALNAFKIAIAQGRNTFEILGRKKDGSCFHKKCTLIVSYDENNKAKHLYSFSSDISPEKQAQEDLKAKSKELERSNYELEQFAYITSHDLQEPIRTLSSYVDIIILKLNKEKLEDPSIISYLQTIKKTGARMRELISDVLTFSKTGKTAPKENVDLNQTIEEILQGMQQRIEESKAKISVERMPVISANKTEMQQLFQNFISNAIKYCPQDRTPEVNVICNDIDNNSWEFTVKDNGIGIPEEYHKKIFNLFQRLHSKDEYEGTGLGLAICKKIIDNYQGKIRINSKPGEGTSFSFVIKSLSS
jgi:PAS domain S-box-containing protein